MDRRQKNVEMLFEAGDKKGAMKAQSAMEDMRLKYDTNRKEAEGKGWGGSGLGMSDEDYNLQPEAMTSGQRAAQVTRLNKTPQQLASEKAMLGDQGRRQQGTTSLVPPPADAPQGPTSFGVSDTSRGVQPVSAAETATAPSSQYQLQGRERKREQDDWMERNVGGPNPYGDAMRKDRLDMSNDLLTDEERKRAGMHGAFTGLKGTNRFQ